LHEVSEKRIQELTGRDWRAWRAILDAWGASDRGHAARVRYLGHYHRLSSALAECISAMYEESMRRRAVSLPTNSAEAPHVAPSAVTHGSSRSSCDAGGDGG
jgi:hypothetical protein